MTVGELLRELRTEKELSQRDVANATGIDRKAIIKAENASDMKLAHLEKMLLFYRISFSDFFCKVDGMEKPVEVSVVLRRKFFNERWESDAQH